jgi:hypothetical protein
VIVCFAVVYFVWVVRCYAASSEIVDVCAEFTNAVLLRREFNDEGVAPYEVFFECDLDALHIAFDNPPSKVFEPENKLALNPVCSWCFSFSFFFFVAVVAHVQLRAECPMTAPSVMKHVMPKETIVEVGNDQLGNGWTLKWFALDFFHVFMRLVGLTRILGTWFRRSTNTTVTHRSGQDWQPSGNKPCETLPAASPCVIT